MKIYQGFNKSQFHYSELADYVWYATTGGFTADIVITDANNTNNGGCAYAFIQSNNNIFEYDVVFSTPDNQLTDIEGFLNTILQHTKEYILRQLFCHTICAKRRLGKKESTWG